MGRKDAVPRQRERVCVEKWEQVYCRVRDLHIFEGWPGAWCLLLVSGCFGGLIWWIGFDLALWYVDLLGPCDLI